MKIALIAFAFVLSISTRASAAGEHYLYTGRTRTISYREASTGRDYAVDLSNGKTYPASMRDVAVRKGLVTASEFTLSVPNGILYTGHDKTVSYVEEGTGRVYELPLANGQTYPPQTVYAILDKELAGVGEFAIVDLRTLRSVISKIETPPPEDIHARYLEILHQINLNLAQEYYDELTRLQKYDTHLPELTFEQLHSTQAKIYAEKYLTLANQLLRDARLSDTPKNRLKVILADKYTMQIIWEHEDAIARRNREAAIGRAAIQASINRKAAVEAAAKAKAAAEAAAKTCEGLFR